MVLPVGRLTACIGGFGWQWYVMSLQGSPHLTPTRKSHLEVLSGSIVVWGDAGGDEEYQQYSNSNVLAKTANQIP